MSPRVDDGLSGDEVEVNDANEVERQQSIEQLVVALVHAAQCVDGDCDADNCRRLKAIIQHVQTCEQRSAGGCPICKQLVALCCHHARNCLRAHCPVPFCFNIKWQLREEEDAVESGM